METMGKKRPRPRRAFTPEFKAQIVELCLRDTADISQDVAFQTAKKEGGLDSGIAALVQARVMDPCRERIIEVLTGGIAAGLLRPGVDTAQIADVGPAMLIHYAMTTGPDVPEDHLVSIVDGIIMPLIGR